MSPDVKEAIFRRSKFLLEEAQVGAKRDQAITYVMRVLSNYAAIGRDAGSGTIKDENRKVSKAAKELLFQVSDKREWQKRTINEHPFPLKETWFWLLENASSLTTDAVWQHFVDHPMITVTKVEDERLRANGFQSQGGLERYRSVGIEIVALNEMPIIVISSS